jgi:hypothetical protein
VPRSYALVLWRSEQEKSRLIEGRRLFQSRSVEPGSISIFAAHSGRHGLPERGRTKGTRHWNVERLSKLGQHWLEAEQATPGISDSQAAARIWKKYPKQYQSDEAIRPNLPDARLVSSAASKLLDEKEKTQLEILARSINRASRVANLVIEDLQGAPSREKRRQDLKWVANFFSRVDRAKVHLQEAVKRSQAKAKRLEAKVKKTQAKTASSALIRAGE